MIVRKDNGGKFTYNFDNINEKKGVTLDKKTLSIATDSSVSDSLHKSIPKNKRKIKN